DGKSPSRHRCGIMMVVFRAHPQEIRWGTDLGQCEVDTGELVVSRLTSRHPCAQINTLDVSVEITIGEPNKWGTRRQELESTRRLRVRHQGIRHHVRGMNLNECRSNRSHESLL